MRAARALSGALFTLLVSAWVTPAQADAELRALLHEARHGRSTTVEVSADSRVEVVLGPPRSSAVIVYMHGVCGDPFAFRSWARAAGRYATFLSLRGDLPCGKRPSRRKWSWDLPRLDRRIRAAVAKVSALRERGGMAALGEHPVLVGYSQGALRAEHLATRFPERYRRVALMATPKEPSAARLRKAERVLLVAGGWDAREHIVAGYRALQRRKAVSRYVELPKARHGQYGPAAPRVMDGALRWLLTTDNPGQTPPMGTKAP